MPVTSNTECGFRAAVSGTAYVRGHPALGERLTSLQQATDPFEYTEGDSALCVDSDHGESTLISLARPYYRVCIFPN